MGAALKRLLAEPGRLIRVFAVGQLCHPKVVELIGLRGGFDAVWLDQEHVGLTIPQIEEGARAARGGGPGQFRALERHRLRHGDASAGGRSGRDHGVDDPQHAAGGGRAALGSLPSRRRTRRQRHGRRWRLWQSAVGGIFRRANAETVVALQIEHADAVDEVETIAALPGLDFLFVGPADLSQSLGLPGEWNHPRMWAALERVARAAADNKVPWAVLPCDAAYARRCVEHGLSDAVAGDGYDFLPARGDGV